MYANHKFANSLEARNSSKLSTLTLALSAAAIIVGAGNLAADTVVIAPGNGATTNVLSVYSGDTALSLNPGSSGGGIVTLNKGNSHTNGTTLGCGTLLMTHPGQGDRSPVGAGVFAPGPATLRYAGPDNATFMANVAPSFQSGSTAACVFDVQNDLSFAGVWNQPYGGFIKTGPGTLSIAGSDNSTNWFSSALLLDGIGAITDASLAKKIVFNENGDAPAEGFSAFSVVDGTFRIESGVNVFGTVTNAVASQVGAWTTDEGTEKSAVLEIAGGANAFFGYLVAGRQNGSATTGGDKVHTGVRVTGGTTMVTGRMILGWNGDATAYPSLDSRPFYEQTGGAVTLSDNLQLGYENTKGVRASVNMTGGTFNISKNIVSGFKATHTTNTIDVSGTAVLGCAGSVYVHNGNNNGAGNMMDINVHDGGTLGAAALYNGSTATKTKLRVDGGVLRNDKNNSYYTAFFHWIGGDSNKPLTSFTVGPKGLTFLAKNGNASGVAQVYSPITAEPAGEGETAAGVTIKSGRFAFYVAMDYEGPTLIKNGAVLYLSANGMLPATSAVTVEGGGMLRLLGVDKTISSLTLEDSSTLGFGTPPSDANAPVLTVTDSISFPARAKISLYAKNDPSGQSKSDNGTYEVLRVPVSYADAMRSVEWLCPSVVNGKSATFSVTTAGDYATLSVTISDATAGVYPADSHTVTNTALSVSGDIDLYGTLQLTGTGNNGNVNGSESGGSLTVHNGGVLDASNGNIIPANVAGSSFDLYLEDGGSIFVKEIKAAGTTWDSDAYIHFNGGTIYPLAAMVVGSDGGGYQMLLNYQTATLGEHGLTIDLSRWVHPANLSNWGRVSIQGKILHDPDCAGADGGIVIRGNADEKLVLYFGGRMFPSTFNGGIRVEDGCIASSISYALVDLALTMEPGTRLRPFFGDSPVPVQVGTLTLGAANATKPVALDVSSRAMPGCYVVSNEVSVLSTVELGTCANWNSDIGISAGVFTALVYRATCNIEPNLFQAPAGYLLSAEEVLIAGGDYDGWKALVCTVTAGTGEIVVTGSTSYPTPRTVSGDVGCARVVLGGTYGGEEDPCVDTSLTISGNVKASGALYLGYEPRPGVDANHPHQGFLTIGSGASLSVSSVYSVYRASPIDSTKNPRYGCELTVDGGELNVAGDVQFGYQISKSGDKLYSQLNVDNGGRVAVGGTFYLYYLQRNDQTGIPGCIVLNDGEVDVKGVVDLSRNGKRNFKTGNVDYDSLLYHFGLYLNGGVLKAENIKMTEGSSIPKVYFNNGTFMPYGKAEANRTMQNLYRVYVSTGGAIVSTANMPQGSTYTIAQPLLTDPALEGAADGGFTKCGENTLVLSGVNTFTGPVSVEDGMLVAATADAISDKVALSDSAALDLSENDVTLDSMTARGIVLNGGITVTNMLYASASSYLTIDGAFTIGDRTKVTFLGEVPSKAWFPVVAAGGTISAPGSIKSVNTVNGTTYFNTTVQNGVLYMRKSRAALMMMLR